MKTSKTATTTCVTIVKIYQKSLVAKIEGKAAFFSNDYKIIGIKTSKLVSNAVLLVAHSI